MENNRIETMDQALIQFIGERQDAIHQGAIFKDKRFISVNEKIKAIELKIKELVPIKLFLELDRLYAEDGSIREDYIYRQGFFDGMKLLQMQNEPIKYRTFEDSEDIENG